MSRPWRIAMLVGSFPVISETFILRQITGLLDLGHAVDIYANTRPDPKAPVHPEVQKYQLLARTVYMDGPPETVEWEMPIWPLSGRTWPPGSETSIHNLRRALWALPKFVRALVKSPALAFQVLSPAEYGYQAASLSGLYRLATLATVSHRYDVLHAHFGPVGSSFRFARRLWHAPLCVSFHGYDFSTLPRQEGRDMYRKLFADADVVTVSSAYARRQLEGLGCPPDRLQTLPVGLDLNDFPFRERRLQPGEPVRLLTVARLVEIKGHEYLVRAVDRLRRKFPAVRCDIVGDGPLRENITSLIQQLKLEHVVELHGSLDSAAVKRLLDQAHIFALVSVNVAGDAEGQGLALQEAQAAGLPVIATQHGALPEGMLPGESGFLVPERDVDALAERLNYLVEHPEIWPMLGRNGRSFVEARYDIRKLNQQLTQLYAAALERFRNSCPVR